MYISIYIICIWIYIYIYIPIHTYLCIFRNEKKMSSLNLVLKNTILILLLYLEFQEPLYDQQYLKPQELDGKVK